MLIFGLCFVLYFFKLSAGIDFFIQTYVPDQTRGPNRSFHQLKVPAEGKAAPKIMERDQYTSILIDQARSTSRLLFSDNCTNNYFRLYQNQYMKHAGGPCCENLYCLLTSREKTCTQSKMRLNCALFGLTGLVNTVTYLYFCQVFVNILVFSDGFRFFALVSPNAQNIAGNKLRKHLVNSRFGRKKKRRKRWLIFQLYCKVLVEPDWIIYKLLFIYKL